MSEFEVKGCTLGTDAGVDDICSDGDCGVSVGRVSYSQLGVSTTD